MAASLKASDKGLEIVDRARRLRGWIKTEESWWQLAQTSCSVLKRFWRKIPIQRETFVSICEVVGVNNWEEIADWGEEQKQGSLQDDQVLPSEKPTDRLVDFSTFYQVWVGRELLITELSEKIRGNFRLLILVGITGIGKTALAGRLVQELQREWDGFYRVAFEDNEQWGDFTSFADTLLTQWNETVTSDDRKDPERLLNRVIKHLQTHQYLLLIDSLEYILEGNEKQGWSGFKQEWWIKFFQRWLQAESCNSRIILTSQDCPGQLQDAGSRYSSYWHLQPLSGLTPAEQLELFEQTLLDVMEESRSYLKRIGEAYEGHPLALKILTGEIKNKPFEGDVIAYWNKHGKEIEEVEKAIAEAKEGSTDGVDDKWQLHRFTRTLRRNVQNRLEKTFERLEEQVKDAYILLCEAAVYRCPVPEEFWLSHLEDWDRNEEEQRAALEALMDRYLVEDVVEHNDYLIRQHNLVRSVSLEHLKQLEEDNG